MPKRPDPTRFQEQLDERIRRASVWFQRNSGIPTAAGMDDYAERMRAWAEEFGAFIALHNYQRRDPSNPYFDPLEDVLLVGPNRAIASGHTAYIERTTGVATEELIERVRARGGDALLRGTDLDALKSFADNVYTYHPEALQGTLDANRDAFVESGVPTSAEEFMHTWVNEHVHLTGEAHGALMAAANEPKDPSDPAFQALLRERDEVRAATAEAALQALSGVVGECIRVRDVTELPNYEAFTDGSPDFFPGSGKLRILGLDRGPVSLPSEGAVSPDLELPWVAMQQIDDDGNPIGDEIHARPDYLARFAGQGLRVAILGPDGQPVRGAHDVVRQRQTAAEVGALAAVERERIEVRSSVEAPAASLADEVDVDPSTLPAVDPKELAGLVAENVLEAIGHVDETATRVAATLDRLARRAIDEGLLPDPTPRPDLEEILGTDEAHAAARPTAPEPDGEELTSYDQEVPLDDVPSATAEPTERPEIGDELEF